jgi:hypothetical protein
VHWSSLKFLVGIPAPRGGGICPRCKRIFSEQMRRSSVATSDGQIDHSRVKKPRISRQKPVTWPDTAFGHLTGYVFVGQTSPRRGALAGGVGRLAQTGHDLAGGLTSARPRALGGGVRGQETAHSVRPVGLACGVRGQETAHSVRPRTACGL